MVEHLGRIELSANNQNRYHLQSYQWPQELHVVRGWVDRSEYSWTENQLLHSQQLTRGETDNVVKCHPLLVLVPMKMYTRGLNGHIVSQKCHTFWAWNLCDCGTTHCWLGTLKHKWFVIGNKMTHNLVDVMLKRFPFSSVCTRINLAPKLCDFGCHLKAPFTQNEKETGLKKGRLENNKLRNYREEGFKYKNSTDCRSGPYCHMSLNTACREVNLVDPNPAV